MKTLTMPTTTIMGTILMMMMMMMARSTHGSVTCNAVTTDLETSVICDFGQDLKKSRWNFFVEFYYPDVHVDPEMTLMCNLKESKPHCQSARGVKFNEVVTDKITLTRPPSADKVGGKYICRPVPRRNGTNEPCTLFYREMSAIYVTPPQIPNEMPAVSMTPPQIPNERDGRNGICTISLIVLLLFIVFVLGFICVLYRKRKRIRKWWTHTQQNSAGVQADQNVQDGEHLSITQTLDYIYMRWKEDNKKRMEPENTDDDAKQTQNQPQAETVTKIQKYISLPVDEAQMPAGAPPGVPLSSRTSETIGNFDIYPNTSANTPDNDFEDTGHPPRSC